ncbi:hypothetical protein WI23_07920 [Burkholderia oklahomensis C6786]|nr:hypothetical protein WI23_07920 [Burkholderia oklahomensis C6786]KUY51164.1 hypothetical protein WI23_25795 [Burkholderia oklahomensis C6786]
MSRGGWRPIDAGGSFEGAARRRRVRPRERGGAGNARERVADAQRGGEGCRVTFVADQSIS